MVFGFRGLLTGSMKLKLYGGFMRAQLKLRAFSSLWSFAACCSLSL